MNTPLIRLKDLTVRRGGRPILDLPELSLPAGQLTGVVGPNGSGKSTLLKVLGLLLAPDSGTVEVNGRALSLRERESPELVAARRRITMVFQSPALLARSVADNVAAGLRFRGVDAAETARRTHFWLDRLGVSSLAGRRPAGLSGGEVQRVALARALVLEPDLLLLDEPTANLDFPTRSRLMSDLREILAEIRAGAVLVTHDIHEAPHFADRLLVMINGRVVQEGLPREVVEGPADVDTAVFLGFENVLPVTSLRAMSGYGGSSGLAGRSGGPPVAWLCIQPEKVSVSAEPAASEHAAAYDGPERLSFAGPVKRLAPWGSAYRVAIELSEARGGLLTGSCSAARVLDGSVAQGRPVRLSLDPRDGVQLGDHRAPV